jgi:ribosomal protein S18 acetylase RimI-like enzyme
MHIDDYQVLYAMWETTPGITLRKADSLAGFQFFLERNPGLSLVAECGQKLVGGILGGQDGRFGSIHHLVVLPEFRRHGWQYSGLRPSPVSRQEIKVFKPGVYLKK